MGNIELVPLELITSNSGAIRKAREAFLISKGKTLEPFGLNRRDETWSIYFLFFYIFPFWYTFKFFSISVNPGIHISFSIILNFVNF